MVGASGSNRCLVIAFFTAINTIPNKYPWDLYNWKSILPKNDVEIKRANWSWIYFLISLCRSTREVKSLVIPKVSASVQETPASSLTFWASSCDTSLLFWRDGISDEVLPASPGSLWVFSNRSSVDPLLSHERCPSPSLAAWFYVRANDEMIITTGSSLENL